MNREGDFKSESGIRGETLQDSLWSENEEVVNPPWWLVITLELPECRGLIKSDYLMPFADDDLSCVYDYQGHLQKLSLSFAYVYEKR